EVLGTEIFDALRQAVNRALRLHGSPAEARKLVLSMLRRSSYLTPNKIIPYFQTQFYPSVTVNLTGTLQHYAGGKNKVELPGFTYQEVIASLVARYPALQWRLRDKKGQLRNEVNFSVMRTEGNTQERITTFPKSVSLSEGDSLFLEIDDAPLIEDGTVNIFHLRTFLLDQIQRFRRTHPDLPEITGVVITGSALYLSNEENNIPIKVLQNPDLIGDIDIALVIPEGQDAEAVEKWFPFVKSQGIFEPYLRERLKDAGIDIEIEYIHSASANEGKLIMEQSALVFETLHDNALGREISFEEFLVQGQYDTQNRDITAVKECLKLEFLFGDLKRYRHYRDQLVKSQDPIAEARSILSEIHRAGRLQRIFENLPSDREKARKQKMLQQMEKRLSQKALAEDSAVQIERSVEASASSPIGEEKGGIDFRVLPIATQFNNVLHSPSKRHLASAVAPEILSRDWQEIERMIGAGIIPSTRRIQESLEGCALQKDPASELRKVLRSIMGILRIEEMKGIPTDDELSRILAAIDSGNILEKI
ncbi:MAG: hypothetical protein KKC84_00795, partial [Candidatus Omnitrophica bacterium]|nr:hypothetical protein [Candidatus Omnitrophota bacterium]